MSLSKSFFGDGHTECTVANSGFTLTQASLPPPLDPLSSAGWVGEEDRREGGDRTTPDSGVSCSRHMAGQSLGPRELWVWLHLTWSTAYSVCLFIGSLDGSTSSPFCCDSYGAEKQGWTSWTGGDLQLQGYLRGNQPSQRFFFSFFFKNN